jgi:hypothetical protein
LEVTVANRKKHFEINGIEFHECGISINLRAAVGMVNAIKDGMGDDLVLKIKPDGKLTYAAPQSRSGAC